MNAGGHAGRRSRVQSHIQRASGKQAHLPAIGATACEMVRSSTKAVAHAATLSLTRPPAVTLCNEVLAHVCAAWAGTATPCTAPAQAVAQDSVRCRRVLHSSCATGPYRHHAGSTCFHRPKALAGKRWHSCSGAHGWFAFAPGLEHWQKCAALDARLKAFTQASTWLHKHPAHFTDTSLTAPASCLCRIGFYLQRKSMRSH